MYCTIMVRYSHFYHILTMFIKISQEQSSCTKKSTNIARSNVFNLRVDMNHIQDF